MCIEDTPFGNVIRTTVAVSAEEFTSRRPFPHIFFDGLFEPATLAAIHDTIMAADEWERTANPATMTIWRSQWRSEYCIPEPARELVRFLNSGLFLRELSRLSGIPGLIADPYFTGGGFHRVGPGGRLGVHVDGNWHEGMGVHRRLNVILYLNLEWRDEWGGRLGLYADPDAAAAVEIAARPGRLVLFETHDFTFHGYPEPLACPDDQARTSIILYYYSAAPRPGHQVAEAAPHSALWKDKGWHDVDGHRIKALHCMDC